MPSQFPKVFIFNPIVAILYNLPYQSLKRPLSQWFRHPWPLIIGKSNNYPLVIPQLNHNRNRTVIIISNPVPKPLLKHSHQMQDKLSVGLLCGFCHRVKFIGWLLELHRYPFVFPQFKGKIEICSHFVFLRA